MRVNIEHNEIEKGFIKKKKWYQVVSMVEFSEEEKAIIEENDLKKAGLVTLPPDPVHWKNGTNIEGVSNVGVGTFLIKKKDITRHFASKNDAKFFEEELLEALKALKSLMESAGGELENKTVEI